MPIFCQKTRGMGRSQFILNANGNFRFRERTSAVPLKMQRNESRDWWPMMTHSRS
jgi:hypothetical protein